MNNINKIKKVLLGILIISAVIEILVFPSLSNFIGVVVSLLSTVLYFEFILKPEFYKNEPLLFFVSIIIFGFMYFPLPATLLDGRSMSHDLYNPELTYILQFIYFLLFICTVLIASKISNNYRGLNHLLKKIGFFYIPTFSQTYLLAVFGWVFRLQILMNQFSGEGLYVSNIGTYTMFSGFIYAPLINLARELVGGKPCSNTEKIITWIYLIAVSLSMVATNSRSAVLSAAATLFLCYVIKWMLSGGNMRIFKLKYIIISIILFLFVTGPLNDMAYAMLITRSRRTEMSYNMLFSETIKLYNDKKALNKFRSLLDKKTRDHLSSDWNEDYVSNVFLQRICNYRVVDASIHHAFRAGTPNKRMTDDFGNRLIAMFPQPIVNIIDPTFKKARYANSPMDLLYAVSSGRPMHVSYIVGGDVGIGLATFGFFYFPLMFLVYLIEFLLISNLVRHTKLGVQFSILTLMGIYGLFLHYSIASGLISHVIYILWTFWWNLIWLYIPFRLITFIRI